MTDAPKQIWAEPGMPGYFYEPNELYTVEYTRTDISAAQVQAARDDALREAAYKARNACLVPPDGGSPTEAEADLCDIAANCITALIGTPAPTPTPAEAAKVRSDAISEFCEAAGILGSVQALNIPDDVRMLRMQSAINSKRAIAGGE